jgi:hypothetical protein
MAERSKYQERIIKNYYQNQGPLQLQKLQETITNLYLAEGKQRAKYWQSAAAALEKLKVPASRIQQLVKSDKPELLAKLVEELLAKD